MRCKGTHLLTIYPPQLLIIINNCNTSLISKFFNIFKCHFQPKAKNEEKAMTPGSGKRGCPGLRAPKAVRNPASTNRRPPPRPPPEGRFRIARHAPAHAGSKTPKPIMASTGRPINGPSPAKKISLFQRLFPCRHPKPLHAGLFIIKLLRRFSIANGYSTAERGCNSIYT